MTSQVLTAWPGAMTETMSELADAELVTLAQQGDTGAFSELVQRHQYVVYNLAYRFMRDPTLAEDAAQEAFLRAFRLLRGFRGQSTFATWMYRVTCNVCLTELSRRKRRAEVPFEDTHAGAEDAPDFEGQDVNEAVRRCVAELPCRYASIITMYYLEGLSYEDIAGAMQVPMGTLKTWMHRARKQLRQVVDKELNRRNG